MCLALVVWCRVGGGGRGGVATSSAIFPGGMMRCVFEGKRVAGGELGLEGLQDRRAAGYAMESGEGRTGLLTVVWCRREERRKTK